VYALAYDDRARRRRIWASAADYYGAVLRSSDDFGASWTEPDREPIRFPDDTQTALKQIWQITPGRADELDVLYCLGLGPWAV
jgi:hypothetical protein